MTEWFTRSAGDVMSLSETDPCMGLIADVPDWVRLPPEIDPSMAKLKVSGHKMGKCPKCHRSIVKHLELEKGYGVAECTDICGFVWYTTSEPTELK